jgi:hypothetical protein
VSASAPASPLPGDELIPDANVVFDRGREIAGSPEDIWPWLLQLGKGRAGWYMPARVEQWAIPRSRRAARAIHSEYQGLGTGDQIPDYGGRDETLQVAILDPPRALVYRSERRGARFTWALVLRPTGAQETSLHLRFRGRLRSTGRRRTVIVWVGDLFDWATTELMLAGLDERVRAAAASARTT